MFALRTEFRNKKLKKIVKKKKRKEFLVSIELRASIENNVLRSLYLNDFAWNCGVDDDDARTHQNVIEK